MRPPQAAKTAVFTVSTWLAGTKKASLYTALVHPHAGVAEHAHPGAVFVPLFRAPRVLHGAEYTLRVRHHDGHATVAAGQAGDPARRAVRVGRVAFGDLAVVIDEAHGHAAGQVGFEQGFFAFELGMAFAVGDGDWHARTGHALQEDRVGLLNLHHGHTGFELLGTVTHKVRPELAARDQFAEVGHHLATVAHTQGEAVVTLEEALERITRTAVEQGRLGPAFTGTQHVAVGETAAGDEAFERVEVNATREDVAHVHVDRIEAGAVERSRHFHLAVDALLTQYRNLWANAFFDVRRGDVLVDVEAELGAKARVVFFQDHVEFLLGAVGVVTQALDLVAGLGPLALQQTALAGKHSVAIEGDVDLTIVDRLTDHFHAVVQAGGAELCKHVWRGVLANLDHGAQLFVEQDAVDFGRILGNAVEHDVQAAVTGEGHFYNAGQQAAVGTVVVSQQVAVGVQALDHGEEGFQVFGVIHIRRVLAELAVGLREDRGAHAVLATAQVDQDQIGGALVHAQLRGQGLADVGHRCKTGNDQRQRRGHALVGAVFVPTGGHGHRVLAHRNGDAQLRAQLHADSLDGVVQARVFTWVTGSGHPVGRQFDVGQLADAGGGDVGEGFTNGHAARRRSIQQGQRRALAHGHGFTGINVEAGGGDGNVGHRHLPWVNHLVTGHEAGDGAVADGDQEAFARHGLVVKHAFDAVGQFESAWVEVVAQLGFTHRRTVHARGFAQQHFQRHVDRAVAEVAVGDRQLRLGSGFADHGKRATLTLADGLEAREVFRADGQYVAFLGFVTPDFVRGHARLVVWNVAQFETTATLAIVDQFREGVGQTAGADVVDEADRVLVTQLPATVDDFLAAAFHLWVFALYGSKIQVCRAGAGGHGGSSAAAQADQHGRAAEYDQLGADQNLAFLDVFFTDVAHAAGQHDWLVVAAHFIATRGGDGLFKGTEVTGQGRTPEFVVERGAAKRAFDHDVQRGHDALRLAVRHFPQLFETWDLQVGHGETGQARLWLGATAGGAFVADFAARTRSCARERGNCGRVVVGLNLHQDVHRLLHRAVLAGLRVREETAGHRADDHRGVVLISRQNAFAVHHVGVLDHAEQAFFLAFAVDVPTGVENLVTAVLGVGLGEHHQFDVVRVALQAVEGVDQIIDLVFGQGQAQFGVGLLEGGAATAEHVNRSQRLGFGVAEQAGSLFQLADDDLRHAVVQAAGDQLGFGIAELAGNIESDTALQALDFFQATVAGDITGLARPGRDGAEPRQNQEQAAVRLLNGNAWAVLQKARQHLLFVGGQHAGDVGEVSKFSIQACNRWNLLAQLLKEFAVAKGRKGRSAAQDQHLRDSLGKGVCFEAVHSSVNHRHRHPKRHGWPLPNVSWHGLHSIGAFSGAGRAVILTVTNPRQPAFLRAAARFCGR